MCAAAAAAGKDNRTYLEVRLRRADLQHARDVVRVPSPLEEDKKVFPRRAEIEDDAHAVGENLVRRRQDHPAALKVNRREQGQYKTLTSGTLHSAGRCCTGRFAVGVWCLSYKIMIGA